MDWQAIHQNKAHLAQNRERLVVFYKIDINLCINKPQASNILVKNHSANFECHSNKCLSETRRG